MARVDLTPEQKAALLAERAKTDPCRQYRPGPTFEKYHRSDAMYKAISTNNQSGKTTAIQIECCWIARNIHPYRPYKYPARILCIVPSRAQASVVWGKRLLMASELKGDIGKHPMIPRREIKKVHNAYSPMGPYPGLIELKNGSTIYFALSGDVNSWRRLEGTTFDKVFRDEADGSDNLAEEIQPRLLKAQSAHVTGEKPGAGGIDWAATSTKPNDEWESFRTKCEVGLKTPIGRYELFLPSPDENVAVAAEVRDAMAYTMSAEAFSIRGRGDTGAADLLTIFRKWDDEKIIRKTPYEIGLRDNLWVSYDPGWKHPCGIGIFAINQPEPYKLRLVAYYNYKFGSLREHMRTIAEWLDGRFLTGMICDPSVNRNLPQGIKHLTLLENEIKEQGIKILHPLMLGRNRLEDMIPQVERYLEQGLIEVSPDAPGQDEYCREMRSYRWDEKAIGRVVYRKAKGGDEAPDLTKYIVSRFPAWQDHGDNPKRGTNPLPPFMGQSVEEQVDPYAGLSAEERVHRMRLQASADLYNEHAERPTTDDIGVARWN